jgi:hypothetical protein
VNWPTRSWIASHLWTQYEFTQDKQYLAETAYPLLKGNAQFILDFLAKDPKSGYLMTGPSISPENWFRTAGGEEMVASMMPACDRELAYEILSNCVQASEILNTDREFADSLRTAIAQLPPIQLRANGAIREWFEDFEEAHPNHRHTSHLLALYPFSQITLEKTPELAEAARKTIENRDVAMTIWYAYEDGAYDKYNLTLPEFSVELGKFAKAAIKENPFAYLKQVITKSWFDFWKPTINWNYEAFNFKYANKLFLGVWYLQSALIVLIKAGFLFVFGFHLIQFLKSRKFVFEFLLSSIVFSASVLQALATYGTNNRFSFPFEFMMIILVLLFLKTKVKLPSKLNIWLQ